METISLKNIQAEIKQQKASWKAKTNPLLRLSGLELTRRLGVIPDERNLSELRARPAPDIAHIIAKFRGMRLAQVPDRKIPKSQISVKNARPKVKNKVAIEDLHYSERFDMTILDAIREHILYLPPIVDWRNRKGRDNVTSVKDQGGCGSCVAFGTTATLESMILIEHNVSLDLSEAELLFCGGGSCGGWWPSSAVTYLTNSGIAHESCFPYQDHNMACNTCAERDGEAVKITNSTVIFGVDLRKQYLAHIGPMMCVFEVYDDFFGYGSGVYSHVVGDLAGLHCVEVIGYEDLANCWICKNSWGNLWGDSGFFRIAYGQCGIDSAYPFWGISGTQWYS
jgi:C1A family cysteine protease